MDHILVTGATGFIGAALLRRLGADWPTVRVLVRGAASPGRGRGVDVVPGDVRDPAALDRAMTGVDAVFHLAGKAHDLAELGDTGEHEAVTVIGTRQVLDAAVRAGVKRFLFMSSLSVHGAAGDRCQDEASPCRPTTAYGRAKLAAEHHVLAVGAATGLHVTSLRPAVVYGPGCKGNLLRLMQMIDRGICPPLPRVTNHRSLVHVEDVVQAALLAIDNPAASGRCYIVTDGRPYSSRELYEAVMRAMGRRVPRWHVPMPALRLAARVGDAIGRARGSRFALDSVALERLTGSAWFSADRIATELGYRPSRRLEDALPEMVAAYRAARQDRR